MKKTDLIFGFLLLPLDFFMLVAAGFAAYFVRVSPFVADIRPVEFYLPLPYYTTLVASISLFFVFIFALVGLYRIERKRSTAEEFLWVLLSVSAGMVVIVMTMFFQRDWFDSRFIMLAAWGFGALFVSAERVGMRILRRVLAKRFRIGVERAVLIGAPKFTKPIQEEIERNRTLGLEILGILPTPEIAPLAHLVKNPGAQQIIVADPLISREDIMNVVSFCEDQHIQFAYVPDLFGAIAANMRLDILRGVPVVEVKRTPLEGWGKIVKRGVDLFGAIIMLTLLSPLFLACAFAVKWESSGPVFVRLTRVSQGKRFPIYKFRSMVEDAEQWKRPLMEFNERREGPLFKMKDDPRITRIGKFLRAKRIDELPQLFNVLRGEMSLVGPRPHEPGEVARYERHHRKVLALKAGITGLGQVSGAHDLSFEEEVKLDRYYIEKWSLWMDIAILFKTLKIFLFDSSGQ